MSFLRVHVFHLILVLSIHLTHAEFEQFSTSLFTYVNSYILFPLFLSYLNPTELKYLGDYLYSGREINSVNTEKNRRV